MIPTRGVNHGKHPVVCGDMPEKLVTALCMMQDFFQDHIDTTPVTYQPTTGTALEFHTAATSYLSIIPASNISQVSFWKSSLR